MTVYSKAGRAGGRSTRTRRPRASRRRSDARLLSLPTTAFSTLASVSEPTTAVYGMNRAGRGPARGSRRHPPRTGGRGLYGLLRVVSTDGHWSFDRRLAVRLGLPLRGLWRKDRSGPPPATSRSVPPEASDPPSQSISNSAKRGSPGNSRTHRSGRRVRSREHEDVEQFGASRRPQGVQAFTEAALEFVGSHEGEPRGYR